MPHIYDVYCCGHVAIEDSSARTLCYDFHNHPCRDGQCSSGDQTRFLQDQLPYVDGADMAVLNEITNKILKMRYNDIPSVLRKFDNKPILTSEMKEVGSDEVLKLLCVRDSKRLDAINEYFSFPVLEHALGNAIKLTNRHFFDFCAGQALYWYARARDAYHILNETVEELLRREQMPNDGRKLQPIRWPNVATNYEPQFGKNELHVLHNSGWRGQSILVSAITPRNLCQAAALVKLSQEPLAASILRMYPTDLLEHEKLWRRCFKLQAAARRTSRSTTSRATV